MSSCVVACGFLLGGLIWAQEVKLGFDVAAIRQNNSGELESDSNVPLGPGNVYSPTGGLLSVKNSPLMAYISFAYRMTSTQRDTFAAAAPAWVRDDRFNLQARTDKQDVTKDELRLMMQSLLADRFGMVVHYETRVTSVFAMLLVKPETPGPRLRPHPADGCSRVFGGRPEDGIAPPSESIDGGFPAVCGGLLMLPDSTPTRFHIGARDIPIALISNALPSWGDLGRPVVDQTGLTGNYDFALEFTRKRGDAPSSAAAPTEENEPNFLDALKRQLGLKLEAQKQGVQVLVLDHIDRLSEN
jgi:uncharacterized protein (TIGR03435 family)